MITKNMLERWENLYREIKHPYTEKNRSFFVISNQFMELFRVLFHNDTSVDQ